MASFALTAPPSAISQASCDLSDNVRRPRYRYALVITNGQYPNPDDVLPSAKPQGEALAKTLKDNFGFSVRIAHDQGLGETRSVLNDFFAEVQRTLDNPSVRAGDVASVIYFCGHGIQKEGRNLLVPARTEQTDKNIEQKSLVLQSDILARLPSKSSDYPGLNLVLIDACRTEGNAKIPFAQFASVQGAVVCISSSAGRYAFFPANDKSKSFFCEALLDELNAEAANPLSRTSVEEFITNVERRTEAISLEKFINAANRLRTASGLPKFEGQLPESTKNLREPSFTWNTDIVACVEIGRTKRKEELERAMAESPRFEAIQKEIYPRALMRLCDAFLKDFPKSSFENSVRAKRADAEKTAAAVRAIGVATDTLVIPDPAGSDRYREYLRKASSKADKDAAHLVAWMYRDGTNGLASNPLRYQDFLRLAAELGNGIASYELFEVLRRAGSPDTRKYLDRARALGYVVPKDLPEIR